MLGFDGKSKSRKNIYIKKENAFLLCSPTTTPELPCLFFQIGFTKVVNNFPEFRLSKNFRRRYQRRPMLTHFQVPVLLSALFENQQQCFKFRYNDELEKNHITNCLNHYYPHFHSVPKIVNGDFSFR